MSTASPWQIPEAILANADRYRQIRRAIHAEPELGFKEEKTASLVASHLSKAGFEVTTGIGGTGVVGTLRKGTGARSIGLRADMDALPMTEANDLSYKSTRPGVFHGCGHDGHTATLLAAADYLAGMDFDGTVHLIFQPAEEGLGGARAMIDDGLFDRFPCDLIFGLHNFPGAPVGTFTLRTGPFLAANDSFSLTVHGRGGHVGLPHLAIDPVIVAAEIVTAWHAMLGRRSAPTLPVTLSVTRFHAGEADNAIPDTARLGGSTRTFDKATHRDIEGWMRDMAEGIAAGYGASVTFTRKVLYPPLVNHASGVHAALDAARAIAPADMVNDDAEIVMGSEDFAEMLQVRPGAYILLGAGAGANACMVHDPHYDFNDELIPIGAAYWVKLVENLL